MKGKICFLLFFILAFTTSAYALCEGSYFSETFDYAGTFASQGWTYSNGGCGFSCEKSTPITSPFSTNAFGYNSTMGGCIPCAFLYTRYIRKNLNVNFTEGTVYVSADIAELNLTSPLATNFIFQIGNNTGNSNFNIYVNRFGTTNDSLIFVDVEDVTGQDCEQGFNTTYPYSVPFLAQIDLNSKQYTIFFNNTAYCENYYLGDNHMFFVGGLSVSEQIDGNKNVSLFVDNIQVCSDFIQNVSGELGTPCDTGEDCDTGKCEFHSCVQKNGNEPCTKDSDCISGRCIANKCVKASLSQQLTASVTENFGYDTATLALIALILMIGIPIAILIAGLVYKSSLVALLGVVVFILLGFMFTFMGWLPPFLVLGLLVAILIVVIFIFMIKANS